jgi:hypothetical protein
MPVNIGEKEMSASELVVVLFFSGENFCLRFGGAFLLGSLNQLQVATPNDPK